MLMIAVCTCSVVYIGRRKIRENEAKEKKAAGAESATRSTEDTNFIEPSAMRTGFIILLALAAFVAIIATVDAAPRDLDMSQRDSLQAAADDRYTPFWCVWFSCANVDVDGYGHAIGRMDTETEDTN